MRETRVSMSESGVVFPTRGSQCVSLVCVIRVRQEAGMVDVDIDGKTVCALNCSAESS